MSTDLTARSILIGPFPPTTFGVEAIEGLRDRVCRVASIAGRGDRARVLIVTDRGLSGTPLIGRVDDLVRGPGRPVAVFDAVRPNPTTTDLEAGAAAARDLGAEVLVAIGGGSVLDAAKGIALSASNPEPGSDLTWGSGGRNRALPIIAAPTTSGSGAEVNDYGVVTDVGLRRKFYVGDPSCLASAVILDPQLTVSLPPGPTSACGIDCLTHAIESFTSIRSNPWADALDLQVMGLVREWLPRAVADGHDLQARSNMLLAAHMAGQAMSTTGLGIVHAIGHPLGGRHDVPHGNALALVLTGCLRFNKPACRGRLARCADALGVLVDGASEERNAEAAIAAVEGLVHQVCANGSLSDYGISPTDLPAIVDDALADPVINNTPRRTTASDVRSILEKVL
jgi:alcohol dehydrogenase